MKKSQNKAKWVKNNLKIQNPSKYVALKKNGLAEGGLQEDVTKAAGSVPLWGGVYNATQGISSSLKGSGLDDEQVAMGNYLSPSSGLMAGIDDGEWGEGITSLFLPGLGGQMEAKRNREKKAAADLQQQVVTNRSLQQNAQAPMAFEKGGKLASKLGVLGGGQLNQISKDAVEVKANNPSKTDSVELDNAFVDHNEVIDRKNRVFSDKLGFAKQAKQLEKQKGEGKRFKAANERIESKLDDLFRRQEESKATKKAASYKRLAAGGFLTEGEPKSSEKKAPTFKSEAEHINYYRPLAVEKFTPEDRAVYDETVKTKGQSFADAWIASRGGLPAFVPAQTQPKVITYSGASLPTKFSNSAPEGYRYNAKGGKGLPAKASITKPSKAGGGWMDEVGSVGNILAPTIAAAVARKKLKGPSAPMLENRIGLKKINPAAQLADATNQFGQAQQVAIRNSGQSSDLISALGNLKSRQVQANNQIQGQTQQINTDIGNQEASMNMGIAARNADKITGFRQASNDFSNLKQRLTTENIANLSTKFQQKTAEGNQRQLDEDKMLIDSWKYNESGAMDRQKALLEMNDPKRYKRMFGSQSKGGMIKKAGKKC